MHNHFFFERTSKFVHLTQKPIKGVLVYTYCHKDHITPPGYS